MTRLDLIRERAAVRPMLLLLLASVLLAFAWSPGAQAAGRGLVEDTIREFFDGQVHGQGATSGQTLVFNATTKTWEPGDSGGGSWAGDTLTLDEIVLDAANADTFLNRQSAGVVGVGTASGNRLGGLQAAHVQADPFANTGVLIGNTVNGGVQLGSAGIISWATSGWPSTAKDTGLSRVSAGVLGVGNGTAADVSGEVRAATYSTGTATWTSGTGTPESAVTAPIGSLFTRTDGGASTTLYVKESGTGNTGWIAK